MSLPPEEEERIRKEIREELEETEKERLRQEQERRKEEEAKRLKEERERIFLEEQEKFYQERGLEKYVNHLGKVEWLTPEEIEERRKRVIRKKVRRKRPRKYHSHSWKRIADIVAFVLVVLAGLGIIFYVLKSPGKPAGTYSRLEIRSDVQGAAIYVDGKFTGQVTDGIVKGIDEGVHVVSVAMPGYSAIPESTRVNVVPGKTFRVKFKLVKR